MMFELCKKSDVIPKGDFLFEKKYDGERVKVIKKGKSVQIWNRNRKTNQHQFEKSHAYPEIVEDIFIQIHDFVLDGEMATADGSGLDKFNKRALQTNKLKIELLKDVIPVKFYVFDILECDGVDVRNQPLIIRKTILNNALEETDNIEIVPYYFNGNELWKEVIKNDWEGIVAKKKHSVYIPKRNDSWLKIKHIREMIVDVLGFKETSGRSSWGAIRTNRCDVALTTEKQLMEYRKLKPTKARVKYYGVYPQSQKLRNPVLLELIK